MPRARANGIDIEYEEFGDPKATPLLLVTGLGAQMISWDDAFCKQLAARGFRIIRFDNRDSGLSTRMEAAGPPDIASALNGDPHPAYRLDDMAADAAGLLDALGIEAAHIVGASMGGFISQLIAINHADRALSLTSIMSGPSRGEGVSPTPEGSALLFGRPPVARRFRGSVRRGVRAREGNPSGAACLVPGRQWQAAARGAGRRASTRALAR